MLDTSIEREWTRCIVLRAVSSGRTFWPRRRTFGLSRQDRQHKYKRNSRRVRIHKNCCFGKVTVIKYSECVSVALVILHASTCVALYCHLCPLWPCNVFPHYLINGTNFEKYLLKIKSVFWRAFVRNMSYSKKNPARCCHKCTNVFM